MRRKHKEVTKKRQRKDKEKSKQRQKKRQKKNNNFIQNYASNSFTVNSNGFTVNSNSFRTLTGCSLIDSRTEGLEVPIMGSNQSNRCMTS